MFSLLSLAVLLSLTHITDAESLKSILLRPFSRLHPSPSKMSGKVNVLMVGTGEYTTGYVGGGASDSDKGAGVVALTMFDLRRREKVDRVGMCGVNVSSCY